MCVMRKCSSDDAMISGYIVEKNCEMKVKIVKSISLEKLEHKMTLRHSYDYDQKKCFIQLEPVGCAGETKVKI